MPPEGAMSDTVPARLEAVVFDMDGVVTRTARLHARAWKQLFDAYLDERRSRGEAHAPFDPVRDYLAWVDGKPRYEGVRSFLESRGIEIPFGSAGDGPDVESACGLGNRKDRYFERLLHEEGAEVFEGTVRRIRELRALGVKTALVTSSKHGREIVRLAGLGELFDVVVDGNTAEERRLRGKPNPDIFLEAVRALGVLPGRAGVVEDAASGVEAARRGGFARVVAVNRGANREALEKAGADALVDDVGALTAEDLAKPVTRDLPSGRERVGEVLSRLAGRRLALFLDYDGTLTPIVSRPELAVLSEATREVLRRLAARATVAVVSGRALADVKALVGLEELVYAGNHGFEIRGPDGTALSREIGAEFVEDVGRIRDALADKVTAVPGAWVEDKTHSLSVHYRQVAEGRAGDVEAVVDRALAGFPRLRKHYGKKVIEIRPRIDWDKGRAVLWLLEALRLQGDGVLPMYFGDDVTDEDAFRALAGRGMGVLVSETPRPSAATLRLRDPGEVRAFLEDLERRLPEAAR
jgi:trehalose 6-phosphate phosphatase